MENEKKIKLLWIALIGSIIFSLSLFYILGEVDKQWEDSYDKNNVEWCEMINQGNEVVNILLEELRYYDEGYNSVAFMEMINCFR